MARGTIITRTLDDDSKRYDTVIRINGKQQWKTFSKKKDAEAHLDNVSPDLRDGTYREIKPATFEKYAEKWKEKYLILGELKPSTLGGYAYVLDKHLTPFFGRWQMAAIDTENVTNFRATMLKSGQAPKSVKNLLNLLNRMFADAQEDGYVKVSPMPTRRRKSDKTEKAGKIGRALQPKEAQRLLEQCDDTLQLIVLIGLLAGLRRGEIFGLHWSDIDFEKNVLRVQRNLFWRHGKHHVIPEGEGKFVIYTPKSEKSVRDVDLSPALKKELRLRHFKSDDKHGLIFQSSNKTPLDPHNVYERWFTPAVERARLKAEEQKDKAAVDALTGLTMHHLRHTFGSWKVSQGEDILYVSAQMGHARPSITADVYSHLLEKRRPTAAAKTDDFLFGKKAASSK